MIKQYIFSSEAQALEVLNATPAYGNIWHVEGAENCVAIGHISKVIDGPEDEPIIETSPYFSVDVMWFGKAPQELKQFEVNPNQPIHNFATT